MCSILHIKENVAHRGAEFYNRLRDLQNSSHHKNVEFNNCFIIRFKYFLVVNKFFSSQTSFKTFSYYLAGDLGFVRTWCPGDYAWVPAQNGVEFIP